MLDTGLTTNELSDLETAASCMFGLLSDFNLSSKLSPISSFSIVSVGHGFTATTGGTGAGSSRDGYVKSTAGGGVEGNHKRVLKKNLQKQNKPPHFNPKFSF